MRLADIPRGPEKFPHWHDSTEWAKRTTMTRSRFLSMTPEEFADWVYEGHNTEDVQGFFLAKRWPEGYTYCYDREYTIQTAYPSMKRHLSGWPTILVDTNETFEEWDS